MRNWLIALRHENGMTQSELAKAVGIAPNYVCSIETGKRKVPVWTAKKIAAALGFDWQRFYEDETDADTASEGR